MEKYFSKCINSEIFSGRIANREFIELGYIGLTFHKNSQFIYVDVCGRTSSKMFYLNPITKKQEKNNKSFIEKYINNCVNSDDLKNQLFSK